MQFFNQGDKVMFLIDGLISLFGFVKTTAKLKKMELYDVLVV